MSTFREMRTLLATTAIFEGITGLGLAIVPSLVVQVLLGSSTSDPAAVLMARLAGAAIITMAFACWHSRNNAHGSVMVRAMLLYNVCTIALLCYAFLFVEVSGNGLWPAVLFHMIMLVWCIVSLLPRER